MNTQKRFGLVLLLLVIVMAMSGCYWRVKVSESERGLIMNDGVKIDSVVGPGRYNNTGYYAELQEVDVSAKTILWDDPDLVTFDKQPIGLALSVTYARPTDADKLKDMWRTYNAETKDDVLLEQLVRTKIPAAAKAMTASRTLDQLLGARDDAALGLTEKLQTELDKIGLTLIDVSINNISPDAEYMGLLSQKANVTAQRDVAIEQTKTLSETLRQEEVQTLIEIEKAQRQNAVNAELAKTYELNPSALELERLRLLAEVIGPNDKIYFVPEDADLTLFLGGETAPVVPVPVDQ